MMQASNYPQSAFLLGTQLNQGKYNDLQRNGKNRS